MGIDPALLERRLDELYTIGAEPEGGEYRPLYGPAWATAVERVERWLKDAGLKTRRDAVGNLWGRAEGRDKGKSIVTGSHIDTVRRGGRLDGALGIVAGLTAVEALLKDKRKPRRPLEVVPICEEEGSRFATNFWGSRAIIGAIDQPDASVAEAMRERSLDPTTIATAARDDIDTFVELHIEQGRVLESSGASLAVVSAIVGTAHLEVTVTGRSDHAGTTPMDLRLDALAGAAAMVQAVESIANSLGRPAVATVGERIRSLGGTISEERRLGLMIRTLQEKAPVAMHAEVRALLARAAKECGGQATDMVSGAGHDAQIMAAKCKVGMLFVPSIGGW